MTLAQKRILKPEDQLTAALAAVLDDPTFRCAFWTAVAPPRLRAVEPAAPRLFGQLGTSKPDLIFYNGSTPLLYVEAKLEAQTQPLQLIRARSWMRKHGAHDDQLVYLSHFADVIPPEIGWPSSAGPISSASWQTVRKALSQVASESTPSGQRAFSAFEILLRSLAPRGSVRLKTGLNSALNHGYGQVLHEFASSRSTLFGDFVYGARIAPRLTYGMREWRPAFGNTDGERVWLFYGPDGVLPENYRAQLIVWHRSDFAGSEVVAQSNWKLWKDAIAAEPLAQFEWGGRQHTDRTRGKPPVAFPKSFVGLVNLPSQCIEGSTAIRLSRPQLLKAISDLVAPLERIVSRVTRQITSQ